MCSIPDNRDVSGIHHEAFQASLNLCTRLLCTSLLCALSEVFRAEERHSQVVRLNRFKELAEQSCSPFWACAAA